jgi:hypothetical protein
MAKHCAGCRCAKLATEKEHTELRRLWYFVIAVANKLKTNSVFTDDELVYAATARCKCGAGLAYLRHCPRGASTRMRLEVCNG